MTKVCPTVEPCVDKDVAAGFPDPLFTVRDKAHLLELLDEGLKGPFHKVTDEVWEQRRQEIHWRHAARS